MQVRGWRLLNGLRAACGGLAGEAGDDGSLAEGVFPVELVSLFALAVFIDLVTKWMALAHKYLEAKGKRIVIWYRVFWRFPRRIEPE